MKKPSLIFSVLLIVALWSCGKDDNASSTSDTVTRWVNLGLPSGLLWADRNVGASSPEDYGNYYAWGETMTKSVFDWSTYRHSNGDYDDLIKYCDNSYFGYNGFTDTLTRLQPIDDAATVNMGGGARTPTREEWRELIDNTSSTWMTQNGVNGLMFTGSNGCSLFLPVAGYHINDTFYHVGEYGYYWSSSLHSSGGVDSPDGVNAAFNFFFNSSGQNVNGISDRTNGFSVRAVRSGD